MRSIPTLARRIAGTPTALRLTCHRLFECLGVSISRAPRSFAQGAGKNGPLFSCTYKLLFEQTLCNHIHLRCPLCYFRATSAPALRRVFFRLIAVFSIACSFLVRKKRSPLFVFNGLQFIRRIPGGPLFQKHPGAGYPFVPVPNLSAAQNLRRPSATWTCLAHPTIITALPTVQVHG
jgi:hypothetical protein